MTYFEFHLLFTLPPLVVLGWLARKRLARCRISVMLLVALLAMAFSLPWDHAAVARGIWRFDDARVVGRIWLLPVEEVLFFVLETVGVCLLCLFFLPSPNRRKS